MLKSLALIWSVLVPLAPALRAELAPGGTLVASGIFIDDALQRFGSVKVKAESRHGSICSVNGNGRWLFRQGRGDPGRV